MAKHPLPTVEYLRQLVDYDPETGLFTYRHVASMSASRNTRFAGKPAFTRHHKQGYRAGMIGNANIYAHRAAWAWVHGEWPDGEIDHINHDRADNRIANLRVVSKSGNMRNMPKLKNNTSGATGVYWDKSASKWSAKIRVDRKLISIGYYQSFTDAVAARMAAEARYGFHANHGVEAN